MKLSKKRKNLLRDYAFIIFGTFLMGIAYNCIYDQIGLVTGGFTGIGIIVKSISGGIVSGGIPLWVTNLALNVPFFLLTWLILGKRFLGRSVIGMLLLTLWLALVPQIDLVQGDYAIAAIFGGVTAGAGMGFVLRGRATTGGTDMVAALLHKFIPHISIVQLLQFLDGVIVVLGCFTFGLHATLYAIVAIYITAKVSDLIMEGFKYSKAAYIITSETEKVTEALLNDLDRGVTGLKATGMYTGDDKTVLYCVVSTKEIVALKELVVEIDPAAFVIVSDVREVLGEGFLDYQKDGIN